MLNYHLTINDQDGESTATLKTTEFRVSGLHRCPASFRLPSSSSYNFPGLSRARREASWAVPSVPLQQHCPSPCWALQAGAEHWMFNLAPGTLAKVGACFCLLARGEVSAAKLGFGYPGIKRCVLMGAVSLASCSPLLSWNCFPQALFAHQAWGIWVGTQKGNLLNYVPLQVQRSLVCGAQMTISAGHDSWW